jgi:hypothetical protein
VRGHPGVVEGFRSCKACASSPPRMRRSSCRPTTSAAKTCGPCDWRRLKPRSGRGRYEPGGAARATSPAGTERSPPGLLVIRRLA